MTNFFSVWHPKIQGLDLLRKWCCANVWFSLGLQPQSVFFQYLVSQECSSLSNQLLDCIWYRSLPAKARKSHHYKVIMITKYLFWPQFDTKKNVILNIKNYDIKMFNIYWISNVLRGHNHVHDTQRRHELHMALRKRKRGREERRYVDVDVDADKNAAKPTLKCPNKAWKESFVQKAGTDVFVNVLNSFSKSPLNVRAKVQFGPSLWSMWGYWVNLAWGQTPLRLHSYRDALLMRNTSEPT